MSAEVDAYIERSDRWPDEMAAVRSMLLDEGLAEEIKWGKPCYTYGGKNVLIFQEMKDFLALMFFKGALLDDPQDVLEAQGPNSRSARRMRVTCRPGLASRVRVAHPRATTRVPPLFLGRQACRDPGRAGRPTCRQDPARARHERPLRARAESRAAGPCPPAGVPSPA